MKIKLGVLMDPIGAINFKKDSTLAMLLAAEARGWELYYMEQPDLFLQDGRGACMSGMMKKTGSASRIRTPPRSMNSMLC